MPIFISTSHCLDQGFWGTTSTGSSLRLVSDVLLLPESGWSCSSGSAGLAPTHAPASQRCWSKPTQSAGSGLRWELSWSAGSSLAPWSSGAWGSIARSYVGISSVEIRSSQMTLALLGWHKTSQNSFFTLLRQNSDMNVFNGPWCLASLATNLNWINSLTWYF